MIDANIVVSAALRRNSLPYHALALARVHDVICMSDAVEQEIRRVIARPKFQSIIMTVRRDHILDLLLVSALRVEPREPVHDCRDDKDNQYLELALAADAEIIVSGDRDLLDLDPWRGVRIMTAAEYIASFDPA
ncbi:MAG TPA: putative toxin-antitoxin system toxin component, PIN family [Stellaceae bacterium]